MYISVARLYWLFQQNQILKVNISECVAQFGNPDRHVHIKIWAALMTEFLYYEITNLNTFLLLIMEFYKDKRLDIMQ